MKLLVDECLSPSYVHRLVGRGYYDTIHPTYIGLSGARDDSIVARALADDRVIITANGRHYRRLLAHAALHPGAIIVEPAVRERTWQQIVTALDHIEAQARPDEYMVNRVIEITAAHTLQVDELP